MIPFKFSPTVRFTVTGTYNDDQGVAQPFAFWLKCERRSVEGIDELLQRPEHDLTDFVLEVAQDWGDVKDEKGNQVPFSEENLRALLGNVPGLSQVCFRYFMAEAGAKAKN